MNRRTLMSSRRRPVLPSLAALWLSACGGEADARSAKVDMGPSSAAGSTRSTRGVDARFSPGSESCDNTHVHHSFPNRRGQFP